MKMQKYLISVKENLKVNMIKIENILKLRTTVIIQVNVEVLHIAYIVFLKKFLKLFKIDLTRKT